MSDLEIKNNSTKSEKRKNSEELISDPKHLKNNYFHILSTDDCNVDIVNAFADHVQQYENNKKVEATTNKQKNNKSINNDTNKTNNNPSTSNKETNNKKIPPLNIYDVDAEKLIEFIKNGLKIKEFKIKEFNKANKKLTLFMTSMIDYEKVKMNLQKTKAKFYTFTPKIEKAKTILLKGLSAKTDTNEIFEELKSFENENLKFVKFATKTSIKNELDLPIFLIQISGDSKINELKAIKSLFYRCIYWEHLKKQEIPQCRRCQNCFHSAANCYLPPRCVKCNDNHESSTCALKSPENERDKLFCVLCKKHGHPASYKGCEKYQILQQKLKTRKQMLKQNRGNKPGTYINSNISFANIVRTNNNLQDGKATPDNENGSSTLSCLLKELQNTVQNVSNQIINLQKQIEVQASRIDTIYSVLNI